MALLLSTKRSTKAPVLGAIPSLLQWTNRSDVRIKNILAKEGLDKDPLISYIYRMKGKNNMQKTITKYQSKFDRLMKSIEKDKILKKMPGNATAGIAVQMIKSLKSYLKANRAWVIN